MTRGWEKTKSLEVLPNETHTTSTLGQIWEVNFPPPCLQKKILWRYVLFSIKLGSKSLVVWKLIFKNLPQVNPEPPDFGTSELWNSSTECIMLASRNVAGNSQKSVDLGVSVSAKRNWEGVGNKRCIYFMLLFLISQVPQPSWVLESHTGCQGQQGFERHLSVCARAQCLLPSTSLPPLSSCVHTCIPETKFLWKSPSLSGRCESPDL